MSDEHDARARDSATRDEKADEEVVDAEVVDGHDDPSIADAENGDSAADQVERDLDELGETKRERDEYLELAQRTRADFENYRKRVAKETSEALARGKAELARELLPVIDNLERALEAGQDASAARGARPRRRAGARRAARTLAERGRRGVRPDRREASTPSSTRPSRPSRPRGPNPASCSRPSRRATG